MRRAHGGAGDLWRTGVDWDSRSALVTKECEGALLVARWLSFEHVQTFFGCDYEAEQVWLDGKEFSKVASGLDESSSAVLDVGSPLPTTQ